MYKSQLVEIGFKYTSTRESIMCGFYTIVNLGCKPSIQHDWSGHNHKVSFLFVPSYNEYHQQAKQANKQWENINPNIWSVIWTKTIQHERMSITNIIIYQVLYYYFQTNKISFSNNPHIFPHSLNLAIIIKICFYPNFSFDFSLLSSSHFILSFFSFNVAQSFNILLH